MRFLAAVLTVALLFGAVGVVTVSASQVDHAAVNAPTGSTTCAGDVDTSVSHAGRPYARIVVCHQVRIVAVVTTTTVHLDTQSFVLPLRL